VWSHEKNFEMIEGSTTTKLIPLSALLTFPEQHLVAKFKYVTMIIAGNRYLVSPYDWVPEGSVVVRDRKSGSVIGIP